MLMIYNSIILRMVLRLSHLIWILFNKYSKSYKSTDLYKIGVVCANNQQV